MNVKRPTQQAKFEGKHAEVAEKILRAFFDLHTELGYDFSEKVYENSLAILMQERGLKIQQQMPIMSIFMARWLANISRMRLSMMLLWSN